MPYFSSILLDDEEEETDDSEEDGGSERRRLWTKSPVKRNLEAQEGLDYIQSGGVVPTFYLAHVDKYNQIVGSDFSSRVSVEIDDDYELTDGAQNYPPILEGQT